MVAPVPRLLPQMSGPRSPCVSRVINTSSYKPSGVLFPTPQSSLRDLFRERAGAVLTSLLPVSHGAKVAWDNSSAFSQEGRLEGFCCSNLHFCSAKRNYYLKRTCCCYILVKGKKKENPILLLIWYANLDFNGSATHGILRMPARLFWEQLHLVSQCRSTMHLLHKSDFHLGAPCCHSYVRWIWENLFMAKIAAVWAYTPNEAQFTKETHRYWELTWIYTDLENEPRYH